MDFAFISQRFRFIIVITIAEGPAERSSPPHVTAHEEQPSWWGSINDDDDDNDDGERKKGPWLNQLFLLIWIISPSGLRSYLRARSTGGRTGGTQSVVGSW